MDSRPFRFVGSTGYSAIESVVGAILREWSTAWFGDEVFSSIESQGDTGLNLDPAAEWLVLGEAADTWIAWENNRAFLQDFANLLFVTELGRGRTLTPMVEAVCRDCIDDLVKRCFSLAMLQIEPKQLPSATQLLQGYGSGAIALTLQGKLPKQRMILSGAVVEAIVVPHRPPLPAAEILAPRQSAIGEAMASIELRLGETELSLAEIVNMSVGDVIALNLHHGEPLEVTSPGGKPLFRANLGRQAANKAIQAHSL